MPRLRVFKLCEDAVEPRYASDGAAGLDLSACIDAPLTIPAGGAATVSTGIAIALPPGHEGQVRPRSGLAARRHVTVLNAPGTVDEDFRGHVQVILVNHGRDDYVVEPGERIAQLVVAPVTRVEVERVDSEESLGATARGTGGFGSTGRS